MIAFGREKEEGEKGWGFVGYDTKSDKAIVQFTGETKARLVSIEEFEKMGGHPQLLSARKSVGRI